MVIDVGEGPAEDVEEGVAVLAVGVGADLIEGGVGFVTSEELGDGAGICGLAEFDAIEERPLAGMEGGFEVGFVFAGVPGVGGRGLATVGLASELDLDGVGAVVAAFPDHGLAFSLADCFWRSRSTI